MRVPLTVALVREHRAAYAGTFASVFVASLVVGGSALLFAAARAGDGLAVVTADDAAERMALESAQLTSGLIAAIGAFGAVFLAASCLGFVVGGRSRELALLRLTGASGAQISRLVLRESALVGGVAAVLGAVASVAVLDPYTSMLARGGLAPEQLQPVVRPGIALAGAALVWAACLLGAWAPAVRVSRIEPVEAVSAASTARTAMSPTRWVIGGLATAGTVALLAIPAGGSDLGTLSSVMVGLAATSIVALTALAPVVVPNLASALACFLSLALPAGALLAGRRVRFDAARTASLANPVVLLVGIGGALFGVAQTGQAASFAAWEPLIDAQVVVGDAPRSSGAAYQALLDTPGVTRVARYDTADLDLAGDDRATAAVAWTDARALGRTAGLAVDAGTLEAVSGTSVAARASLAGLGQSLTLTGPDGRTVDATVVAVFQDATFVGADVLVDHDTFPATGTDSGTWFITATGADIPGLIAEVRQLLPDAQVDTTHDWIGQRIAAGRAGQTGLGPTLLGIAVLTVVALAQSLLTSLRERREEFARLETLGGSRPAIIGSTLVETSIVLATAALLLVGVLGAIQLKAGQLLHAQHLALQPAMPIGVPAATFALMAGVACLATVGGTAWATRRSGQH